MLLGYTIGEICCIAVYLFGRWLRMNPERFGRIFPLVPRFAKTYARVVGMFFMVMSMLGMIEYLILAVLAVVRGS